ncbi:hypothetical protein ACFYVL_44635 [Streptomyces sp. NPDC004111]|uniref:hypothetical protein n=1 Tax=Streptomyces sp. NPDC004111 TaxID=3364690 RepID=UPI0036CCB362
MPAEHGGSGWTLVPDPDAVLIIERIVRELLETETGKTKTVSAIAAGLNADGIPSPRDHWAVKNGRKTGGKTGGVKGSHVVREVFKWAPAPVYKCNFHARGDECEAPAHVRGDWVDDYVTAEFLARVGSVQTMHIVEIPGYDPEPELRATVAEFAEHQEQQGRQKSKHSAAEWQKRADALDNRIATLEAAEKTEPQRIVTPTGRTFADEWATKDTAGKRAMLIEAGVRLDVRRGVRAGGASSTYAAWTSPCPVSWTPQRKPLTV